jgi:hypothetical protein
MYQDYKAFAMLVNTRHLKGLLLFARYKPCAKPNTICMLLYRDSAHAVTTDTRFVLREGGLVNLQFDNASEAMFQCCAERYFEHIPLILHPAFE